MAGNIVRTDRNLAQTEFKIAPKNIAVTKVDARLAEIADDEEADETDATTTVVGDRNVIVVPSAPAQKKLFTKTADSRPVFPPVVITYDKDEKKRKP